MTKFYIFEPLLPAKSLCNFLAVANVFLPMTPGGRVALVLLVWAAGTAAEPPLDPMTVCEAMAGFSSHHGKTLAMLGRYSFRTTGRWLDQEGCGGGKARVVVSLAADPVGPKPPETVSINEAALENKLTAMKRDTTLGKFKFGSPDYDRWAVVFGRLEGDGEKPRLVYRGDGALFILVDK